MDKSKRQLVKAGLAAPLVLTVRTASATAGSSAWACVDRDAKRALEYPTPTKMVETTVDDWLRNNREIVSICQYGRNTPLWNRRFFLGYDGMTWWELKSTSTGTTAEKTTMTTSGYYKYSKVGTGKFISYHKDGDVVGWGWEDKGGKNITASCWTSIKAAGFI
jgi:hypothetical protein